MIALTDNQSNAIAHRLCTAAVRDALVRIVVYAKKSASASMFWCSAAWSLAQTNRSLMRVVAVRDAHAVLRDVVASDPNAKQQWDAAADVLQ